jgi:capsular polysaccharide export protein
MKYILTSVDSIQKYRFFDKLNRVLKSYSCEIVFVTIRLSVYLIGRSSGRKIYLLKKNKSSDSVDNNRKEFLEVNSGMIDEHSASLIYRDSKKLFHLLNEKYFFKLTYIFNGLGVIDRALEDFASDVGLNCKYFELSNIKGKMFIDNTGTNANSSLYSDIDQLSHLQVNTSHYNEWRKNYIYTLKSETLLPQERRVKNINYWYMIDLYGYWVHNIHRLSNKGIKEKIKTKLFLSSLYRRDKHESQIKKPFILVPLQISDDSQLLFHSSFDNFDLIIAANKIAIEKGMNIVVKVHPAEENINFIEEVFRLKEKLSFNITNNNIYELIEQCEFIITINSSVGLLAKIIGKEVIFIGKTYFDKLDSHNLPAYIESFLLNIDFWDEKYELSTYDICRLIN